MSRYIVRRMPHMAWIFNVIDRTSGHPMAYGGCTMFYAHQAVQLCRRLCKRDQRSADLYGLMESRR